MSHKEEYISEYSIEGRLAVDVSGKDIVEVIEAAEKIFSAASFGEIVVTGHKVLGIRDKNGSIVYMRGHGSIGDVKLSGGKYRVYFRVDGSFFPVMNVVDKLTARQLGEHRLVTADFGDMDFIDGNLINIKSGDVVVYVA